jgi:FixJ family two-component response regulator
MTIRSENFRRYHLSVSLHVDRQPFLEPVADILHLGPGTVETHRARIMEKLDVDSAVEIVLYAVRRGSFPDASQGA